MGYSLKNRPLFLPKVGFKIKDAFRCFLASSSGHKRKFSEIESKGDYGQKHGKLGLFETDFNFKAFLSFVY